MAKNPQSPLANSHKHAKLGGRDKCSPVLSAFASVRHIKLAGTGRTRAHTHTPPKSKICLFQTAAENCLIQIAGNEQ